MAAAEEAQGKREEEALFDELEGNLLCRKMDEGDYQPCFFKLTQNVLSKTDADNSVEEISLVGAAIVYAQKSFAAKENAILLATPKANYFL